MIGADGSEQSDWSASENTTFGAKSDSDVDSFMGGNE